MDFEACYRLYPTILMEGALGERLKREYSLVPDEDVALAAMVYGEKSSAALKSLWGEYIAIAEGYHLPFIATTPTRRANKDRVTRSHFHQRIIKDNLAFLKSIQADHPLDMAVGGLMGCQGDAYSGKDGLSADEAEAFHRWQADLFVDGGADFLYAGIMPTCPEALGMARAMEQTGLPYIISFMIRDTGRLLDGTLIHDAISRIDAGTKRPPLCYMTNCVHPSVLYKALTHPANRTALVKERFRGIQANTSPLSPEELDHSEKLISSDAVELAQGILKLKELMELKIVGGCCGTDNSHMEEIAKRLTQGK
jgi:S-methylmethionine-dependent homocysteine/selenocysteine methylase